MSDPETPDAGTESSERTLLSGETTCLILDEKAVEKRRLTNILVMGFAFSFLLTAFNATTMMEKNLLDSVQRQTNGSYTGDAFISQSFIYFPTSVCTWFASSVVYTLGSKLSMMFAGVTFIAFTVSFVEPVTWSLYITSALIGVSCAFFWTAQGQVLSLNSTPETIIRNSGICMALQRFGLVVGNLIEFFLVRDKEGFAPHLRRTIFWTFTVLAVIGTALLAFLRQVPRAGPPPPVRSAIDGVKNSARLAVTPNMSLLFFVFAYLGLVLSFWSSVYTNCVGQNDWLGEDAAGMIGLSGLAVGAGEIMGGLLFTIFGTKITQIGRDPVILFAFSLHTITFYLCYINLPGESPLGHTMGPYYLSNHITTSEVIAIVSGWSLGFADAIYNTQINAMLATVYVQDSAPAFAIFKSFQSFFAAIAFIYSDYLQLQWQLLILVVSNILCCGAFIVVARRHARKEQETLASTRFGGSAYGAINSEPAVSDNVVVT